jgi:septin 4
MVLFLNQFYQTIFNLASICETLTGNTPLHLACSLGRHRAVELLLRYGALPTMPNIEGWHPVAEALSYGNRAIIERVWFAHRRMLDVALRSRKSAILDELNKGSSDFYLEMKWSFSSWIPFTARFCPSDTLKIYKKGSRLRADFTLVGFDNLQWQRGNRSFILSVNPKTSQSTSYLVLDHYSI